jgi:hypothetical protein
MKIMTRSFQFSLTLLTIVLFFCTKPLLSMFPMHSNDVLNFLHITKGPNLCLEGSNLNFLMNEVEIAGMNSNQKLINGKKKRQKDLINAGRNSQIVAKAFFENQQSDSVIIDHAEIIRNLDDMTLKKGREYYNQACVACHGSNGNSSLPTARSFGLDEFKYGSDPYSIWKTIINGAGQMGAQRWLSPEEAYAVVQYIREDLIKGKNPKAYFNITDVYLKSLPRPQIGKEEIEDKVKREALSGSQEFGQSYFENHIGNYGQAIYSQIGNKTNSALTIKLADSLFISYNIHRMSTSVAWKGILDLSKTKYQKYRGEGEPTMVGHELLGFSDMHWSFKDRYHQLENLVSERSPYPAKWLDYYGHYQFGMKTILSYSIVGRKILEMPSVEVLGNEPIIQHTFAIAPGDSWRKIVLGRLSKNENFAFKEGVFSLDNLNAQNMLPEPKWINPKNSIVLIGQGDKESQSFMAVGVQGDIEGLRWDIDGSQQVSLFIPKSTESQLIKVHRYSASNTKELEEFAKFITNVQNQPISDPTDFTEGGDPLWNTTITLKGALDVGIPHYDPIHYNSKHKLEPDNLVQIPENYPYVVDRIPLPFNNPWNSWIRPSGLDFFSDGRLVMSTYLGDVWIANGIDLGLKNVKWQRIATGLYDSFGVKVIKDEIYVTCRDRIVKLQDFNGDGEIDFYESFFADSDVSPVPVQAFNYSLQTDSKGNLLYSKGGQYTHDDEPGHLIQVTPDGKEQQSLAIGFRAPNGVTVGPKDEIYVSDNQGNWMPANKISLIKDGGFYGYIPTIKGSLTKPGRSEYSMKSALASPNYPDDILPDTFDKPIIWLPQEFDNSPGNGAWTPKEWGPLGNRLIHTSFGKGWVYQVLTQEMDEITQAAVSALPFQFSAGTQRARVNPLDGQYYVAGITGWDDSFATKYGSLDRIRYTGGEGFLIEALHVRSNGIEIIFNQKLDSDVAQELDNYDIKQWNYQWTENYGSANWSVKNSDKQGQDTVIIKAVEVSGNGKKLLLKVSKEDLKPVDQMRIVLSLVSEDGQQYRDSLYLTIHKVPDEEYWYKGLNIKLILGILLLGVMIFIGRYYLIKNW